MFGALTTEEGAAMMQAKRCWDESDTWWSILSDFSLGGLVTPANVSDPAGAAQLLPEVVARFGWRRHFWADSTYGGLSILAKRRDWCSHNAACGVEIVRARDGVKGFAVPPKRWIIERTFAWLTHNRRLVRAHEEREVNSGAMILIAATKLHGQTSGKAALLDSL